MGTLTFHVQQVQRAAKVFLCTFYKYGKENRTVANKGLSLMFHLRERSAA